jgi:hypothetical protein
MLWIKDESLNKRARFKKFIVKSKINTNIKFFLFKFFFLFFKFYI